MDIPSMTIGEVAARAGVNPSRIRYYERVGVLAEPEREGGRRRYTQEVLHRLVLVDVAQRAGLSLAEFRAVAGPREAEGDAGERVRALAERKLPELDAAIARAQAVRTWMRLALTCGCATIEVCALFTDPRLAPPARTA